MLRTSECIYPYPSKTVFEDLITRDGPSTYEDWSPFHGQASELTRQFRGSYRARFKQSEFLKYVLYEYKDFDPTKVRTAEHYGMLQESGVSGVYKYLEDLIIDGVEHADVANHVRNMCIGYKKNDKSPLVANTEIYTRTLYNLDGDDDTVEEKYLLVQEDNRIDTSLYEETIRELPYVMKSIWSYSKQYKANLFSFIFAYIDIISNPTNRKQVNITKFRDYHTYLIKTDGTFVREFDHEADNKYVIYPNATKIFIYPDEHRAEFTLCNKFINIMRILGIDYRDENPMEFNNEFINAIVCTYLPNNEEYFEEYKDLDIEIAVALKPENVFDTAKCSIYTSALVDNKGNIDYSSSAYFASEFLRIAYHTGDINRDFLEEDEEGALDFLTAVLNALSRGNDYSFPFDKLTFEADGFLYHNKNLLTFNGKLFGTYNGRRDYTVALTKYKFAIILEEDYGVDLPYILYDEARDTLKEYELNGMVSQEAHWRYVGDDIG